MGVEFARDVTRLLLGGAVFILSSGSIVLIFVLNNYFAVAVPKVEKRRNKLTKSHLYIIQLWAKLR